MGSRWGREGSSAVKGSLSFTSRATREGRQGFDVCWETSSFQPGNKSPAWGGNHPPPLLSPDLTGAFWLDCDTSATALYTVGGSKCSLTHHQPPFKLREGTPAGEQDPGKERQGCGHGLGLQRSGGAHGAPDKPPSLTCDPAPPAGGGD